MKLMTPKVTYFRTGDPQSVHFEVEPLERGVGTTIGTLLEGNLLQLHPVYKPCAFRFSKRQGLDPFQEIEGISECGLEVAERLKKVFFSGEAGKQSVIIRKNLKTGKVMAGDLEFDGLTPTDPGLELFTVNKDGGTFEVLVEQRAGYFFSDDYRKDKNYDPSFNYFDVSFTPVAGISYKVAPARVGRSINFDKLVVDLVVNTGYSPQELMQFSVDRMREFFQDVAKIIPLEVPEFMMERVESDKKNENLGISINDLELSIRCRNCLKQIEIKTLSDLTERSIEELMEIKNFGKKSLDELRDIMKRYNLKFKGEE
ncbi:MAG: DNA-directed RNA polymerase subunit alpha C-terminal domain-containing protein [Candidatus Wallbacteria bacterium]|nr:DNA-directed RNA polymerase subunit alpha C-terminal domain-containing protein [Candidatus Wallbacteria bacterium]